MKILVIAVGNVKSIEGKDFNSLKNVLKKLRVKYEIEVEMKNFKVNY